MKTADAVSQLRGHVDDVLAHVTAVELGFTLRPRLGKAIDWKVLKEQRDLCQIVQDFLNLRVESATVYQGLLVRLASCLEDFIRLLVRRGVETINKNGQIKVMGKDKFVRRNLKLSGKALSRIDQLRAHEQLDNDSIVNSIATCHSTAIGCMLSVDAFAADVSGFSRESIERAMDLLGLTVNWQAIAKHSAFDALIPYKAREREHSLHGMLDRLIKRRHGFAHRPAGEIIGARELREFGDFTVAIGTALEEQLRSHLHATGR